MSKWKKRPVVVDAVQIPRSVDSEFGLLPLIELITKSSDERKVELKLHSGGLVEVIVSSLEGLIAGVYPSWFVIGTLGEPYTVHDDVFKDVYEPWDAEYEEGVAE